MAEAHPDSQSPKGQIAVSSTLSGVDPVATPEDQARETEEFVGPRERDDCQKADELDGEYL